MHFKYFAIWLPLVSVSGRITINGTLISCPGVLQNIGKSPGSCCVGGNLTLSNCPGWPICTGPTSFDPATTTLSCATIIPLTASDYDQLVSSASDSFFNGKQPPIATTPTSGGEIGTKFYTESISSTSTNVAGKGTTPFLVLTGCLLTSIFALLMMA